MIKKAREYPMRLKMEEALLRRLPQNHEKRDRIVSQLRKNKAGYKGEQELDYHLSFLPDNQFIIMNDLRLSLPHNQFFQLDTLLLSPQAVFIIESKNIYGHLFFDSLTKQVIRTFDGNKEGFPNPILQVKRHKRQFSNWLSKYTSRLIPIHTFVSIGYPSTIIETNNPDIYKEIFHAEYIPNEIQDRLSGSPETILSTYQLKKISDLIFKGNTPRNISILKTYSISPEELILGIHCPGCHYIPMKRTNAKWHCPKCNLTSRSIHQQVITDHLLINGSITNQECRQLLMLDNVQTVKRLLTSMKLPYTGSNKNRTYHLLQKE